MATAVVRVARPGSASMERMDSKQGGLSRQGSKIDKTAIQVATRVEKLSNAMVSRGKPKNGLPSRRVTVSLANLRSNGSPTGDGRPGSSAGGGMQMLPPDERERSRSMGQSGHDGDDDAGHGRSMGRSKTMSKESMRVAKVSNIAKKFRLEHFEVKHILEEFDSHIMGSMTLPKFRKALASIFESKDIDERIVLSAWEGTTGETDSTKEVESFDLDGFFQWYVANMFSDVAKLRQSKDKADSEEMIYNLAKTYNVSPYVMDKVKRKFDKFDTDGSGQIEYDEFRVMMKGILKDDKTNDLSEDRLGRFWSEIDRDGSGEVDFQEFAQWYIKYFNPEDQSAMGPIEAFYNSFNPDAQRHNEIQRLQGEGQ